MLWVVNGLIYGFFTALYLLFNQHYKVDGYILGIWRGFGISLLFLPLIFFFTPPQNIFYWLLLIIQGICIGIYDSHVFFASARFGAGPTSRFMTVSVLLTTFMWWLLTPERFMLLFADSDLFMTLLLVLCAFCVSYWQMLQSKVSRAAALYTFPAVIALSVMSIATKYIAEGGKSLGQGLTYYLTVSTFISGLYNLVGYIRQERRAKTKMNFAPLFAGSMRKIGIILVAFSSILIVAKTMALRLAPNPGYVIALLLVAPLFIYLLNKHYKIADEIQPEAGFATIIFLLLLMLVVNGGYGVNE